MVKSEILEPLHALAYELIDVDARQKGFLIEYTEDDIMAAAIVFNHIIQNKRIHIESRTNIKLSDAIENSKHFGQELHEFILKNTGVNTKTYYNKDKVNESKSE